eukprot:6214713-Pleurochrysis_carterae.AAC.3
MNHIPIADRTNVHYQRNEACLIDSVTTADPSARTAVHFEHQINTCLFQVAKLSDAVTNGTKRYVPNKTKAGKTAATVGRWIIGDGSQGQRAAALHHCRLRETATYIQGPEISSWQGQRALPLPTASAVARLRAEVCLTMWRVCSNQIRLIPQSVLDSAGLAQPLQAGGEEQAGAA